VSNARSKAQSSRKTSQFVSALDHLGAVSFSSVSVVQVGSQYGSVDGDLMSALERDDLYQRHHVFDYQVVCNRSDNRGSSAKSVFLVPTVTGLVDLGRKMHSSRPNLVSQARFKQLVSTITRREGGQWGLGHPWILKSGIFLSTS